MKIVLSGVDAGAWSLVALQVILERRRHEVVNLGARTPVERVLRACRRDHPGCLVLSASDGGADSVRLIGRVRADPLLAGLPAVLAGRFEQPRHELLALGFDEAFPATAEDPGRAVSSLRQYLARLVVSEKQCSGGASLGHLRTCGIRFAVPAAVREVSGRSRRRRQGRATARVLRAC